MTRSGKIICEWIENWEVSRSNNWTCSTVNRRIKNLKTFLLLVIQKTSTAAVPKFERISLLEYMNGNITETFRSMSAKLFWRCLHWQGQWTWNRVAFMVVLKEFCEQPDQVFWTFYKVVWSSIQCQRRSRKYCTWRCSSLSQETVLSFQVVFVSSGCAGLLVAWSRLAAVDSIQQCVFEQSSCVWAEFVCLSREQQSSVFEQREPRNADFVHTARCQFALSQADCGSVFWTGYLWQCSFLQTLITIMIWSKGVYL